MFWNKILELCTKNNISPSAMCADIGLSNAIATKWKKGAIPHGTTLNKIANYFNVTTDYLLGKEESPLSDDNGLSDAQKELVSLYDSAPPEIKAAVLAVLKSVDKD